jgi:hypothetical protein
MYANYNEYSAIISIIRVHSRNSRLNSDLISIVYGRERAGSGTLRQFKKKPASGALPVTRP